MDKFKYSCATNNVTAELPKYLELIGYSKRNDYNENHKFICTDTNGFYYSVDDEKLLDQIVDIKSIGHTAAFKAIVALNDRNDLHQWFEVTTEVYSDLSIGDLFIATDVHGKYHIGTKIDPLYVRKLDIFDLLKNFSA